MPPDTVPPVVVAGLDDFVPDDVHTASAASIVAPLALHMDCAKEKMADWSLSLQAGRRDRAGVSEGKGPDSQAWGRKPTLGHAA